ncbi:hypothetical protein [Spiroplasma citri]|uniref:hypothetical protein n=1 Tax=Spiroplasma citri TaxID=2133 RepID=UPI00148B1956|nr:hypothetical protein [Spiroplasma citri]QJU62596.1 hypothetical protein HHA36_09925 [Spiroplasma citri]
MQQIQQTEEKNYHFVEINGLSYKIINQLDENKHISNFTYRKKLFANTLLAKTVIKSKFMTNLFVFLKKCVS